MAVQLSLIEYANTIPFSFGLKQSDYIREHTTFHSHYPAQGVHEMKQGKVTLSILPVAAIPEIPNAHIISPYCIAAKGSVDSVLLCSHKPLSHISSVLLDYQSRTSNMLVQVLAEKLWHIHPQFVLADEYAHINECDARVLIGDRALASLHSQEYEYMYDLAQGWFDLYKLPFVFACWVSNRKLSDDYIVQFNESLQYGISHIHDAIEHAQFSYDIDDYLYHKVLYTIPYPVQDIIDIFYRDIQTLPQVVK
ncbi:MAG: menaquinone biosynthesis protein [Bacteroidales bacterium]|jgi:chorismate dehydratase|nr:menaquinone biosynthesis protein [Bacteroidales bacterium]